MMKFCSLILCVAFVTAAPQADAENDYFELRKLNIFFFYIYSFSIREMSDFSYYSRNIPFK